MDTEITADTPIGVADEQARDYGGWDMLWTWFGAGVNTGSWYFGGVAAALGMAFVLQSALLWMPLLMIPWAAIAYLAWRRGVSTVGVTVPALGTQGSRLTGLGQFLVLSGWPSINTFIAAISLSFVFKAALGWPAFGEPGSTEPMIIGILLTAIAQGVISVLGHQAIRYLERISAVLLIVLGGWETYVVFTHWDMARIMAFSMPNAGGQTWATIIDIAFGLGWTWAQVGDFARLGRSGRGATLGTWLGVNLGQGWFIVIGGLGVIGVALTSGHYDPENSDPSSTLAALGLGLVAFLVLVFSTVSTNVTNIYGAGMGLSAMVRSRPRSALLAVALFQLVLCFVPLIYGSFLDYFMSFLSWVGGFFVPLWTLVLLDWALRRGAGYGRVGAFNLAGLTSVALGLLAFFIVDIGMPTLETQITASLPAIAVTALSYFVLTAGGAKLRG